MSLKVGQETPDSTSIKMYKLEPSSKIKVNNYFCYGKVPGSAFGFY